MTTDSSMNRLPEVLQAAIKREIEEATKEELENALTVAQERIVRRQAEIIASTVLHLEQMVRFEYRGTELVITVIKKEA